VHTYYYLNSDIIYLFSPVFIIMHHNVLLVLYLDWCISEKECGEYCPYYSLKWGDWEKCNCLQNRRFLNCLFPSNPSGISIVNPICEEPLAEYKDCNDPGCYSDWSDWTQCPCGVSHSSRWMHSVCGR